VQCGIEWSDGGWIEGEDGIGSEGGWRQWRILVAEPMDGGVMWRRLCRCIANRHISAGGGGGAPS
jgi:hypothetical protein